MGRVRLAGVFLLVLAAALAALAAPAGALARTRPIFTIGGNGVLCPASAPDCGDSGPATNAPLAFPQGTAIDPAGDVFVVDWGTNEIRKIAPGGTVSTIAGDGTSCMSAPACGDGGPAVDAQLSAPTGIALDGKGDLLIADPGDDEIRMVNPKGVISRFAGMGGDCVDVSACGDGGPATSAQLTSPDGVTVEKGGNVYIADTGDDEIRKVAKDGTITTVAGDGSQCTAAPACGDGQGATSAQLNYPEAVAVDAAGHLFIADNGDNEIREVIHGKVARFAGTGAACAAAPSCGDGGPATRAMLYLPAGLAVDGVGNVYIADWGDNEVRVVSKNGTISRLAGNGSQCMAAPACGDDGPATSAMLSSAQSVGVDASGNVYISDTYDNEIRFVPRSTSSLASARSGSTTVWLMALGTVTSSRTVAVRYVVSTPAQVTLYVREGSKKKLLITRQRVDAGLGNVPWNRHLGAKKAPHGGYTVTVAVTVGHTTISSSLTLTL